MAGGTCNAFSANASTTNFTTTLLCNQTPPSTTTSHHPLLRPIFLSNSSSPTFLGSGSMVSFEGVQAGKGCNGLFFGPYDENGDEDKEEYFHQPEKKRRLSAQQLQHLERSFEEENKLEHERKIQLAKELGLQPRQVAIWFQNRRARWKTKQLEMDYDTLQASYVNLKANYDNLLREKDKLKAEVASLTVKVLAREKQEGNSQHAETNGLLLGPQQKPLIDSASEGEGSKVSIDGPCKHEDIINSARSDIVDSDSPHYTDGVHSVLPETGDSSNVFEHDQSDLSQDEEDNLSKTLILPQYIFPKLEDVDYSDPPHSSCNLEFPEEDHAFWSWSY